MSVRHIFEEIVDEVMARLLAKTADEAMAHLLAERALQQGLPTSYPTSNINVSIVANHLSE